MDIRPNPNKKLDIEIEGEYFYRYPIKTHLIGKEDDIFSVLKKYLSDIVRRDDLVIISKKIISIMQGRAYKKDEIKPTRLAKLLCRFVRKSSCGASLGAPETMQLAIGEIGRFRIIAAALLSAITKPFKIRGVFYRIAGYKATAIDAPKSYAIPPYNDYCFKPPLECAKIAKEISRILLCQVAVVDACDLGIEVLGASEDINKSIVKRILKDNPLGQGMEQTPIAIIRRERPGEHIEA